MYIFTTFVTINDGLMKITRLIVKLLAVISAAFLASCDKENETRPQPVLPEPGPDTEKPIIDPEEYPYKEDTYFIMEDGEYAFKSVAVMMIGENIAIAATPDEGFTDVTDIMQNSSEYIFAATNPLLVALGNDIDLLSEESPFTIKSTLKKAVLETIAPGETSEISGGRCMFTFYDGILSFKAEIILSDNTWLGVHLTAEDSAESPIVLNKNIIGRGDEMKPLRTAFSAEKDGLLYMFMTPANIDYFSELDVATWYLYLVVSADMMNGEYISTADITEADTFMFGMVDNVNPDYSFEIDSSTLSEVNGVFSIEKTESVYRTLWSFRTGEISYMVSFEGECRSVEEEAPVEGSDNFFSCGDETEADISSAELEKGEDTWSLHLNLDNGKTATVTMSAGFFTGGGTFGFSQDPAMCVIYDGTTYSKANGYSGTLTMKLDEEAGTVETEFTNYKDCEFYYYGNYSIR